MRREDKIKLRKKVRRAGGDFKRLFNWYDSAYVAGNFLFRKGVSIAGYTAVFTTGNYIYSLFKEGGSSLESTLKGAAVAIAIPIAVGVGLTTTGFALKNVPNFLSKGKINVAAANDLDLMEDCKKNQRDIELEVFWERLFKYEAETLYKKEVRKEDARLGKKHRANIEKKIMELPEDTLKFIGLEDCGDLEEIVQGVLDARPVTDKIETNKQAFLSSARFALKNPLDQTDQTEKIGFDLSPYEGWRNGGYFDVSDNKLSQQYMGDVVLSDIKKEVGFGFFNNFKKSPRRIWQGLSFGCVTKALAVKVGTAVLDANRKYSTDDFNSQIFFWPESENAKWIEKYDGARDYVRDKRKEILKGVFGETHKDAERMLDRIFLPNFENATELRVRYDPEYCFGGLDYDVMSDLKEASCCGDDLHKYDQYIGKSKWFYERFVNHLKSSREDLFEEGNVESLRAIKVAFHLNKNNFQKKYREGYDLTECIKEAVSQKEVYSKRLRALRLHHQITIFEMKGYRNLLQELAYSKVS